VISLVRLARWMLHRTAFFKFFFFLKNNQKEWGLAMCNVLLIEDEKLVSDMLRRVITRSGHNVETASGGHEGLLKFEKGPFDLVITELSMPGINGRRVARSIRRSEKPNTPIIGMSASPWLLDGDGSDSFIFDSFIPKPFHMQTLLHAINEAALSSMNSDNYQL